MRGVEDALLDKGAVRVCDYDRAGEGRSDPTPEPRTTSMSWTTSRSPGGGGHRPAYVLVGHSVGGDQTWFYADRHPQGVAGFMFMNAGSFELDWDALRESGHRRRSTRSATVRGRTWLCQAGRDAAEGCPTSS